MSKTKELALKRRVEWMADTIDELREQWANKQLECEFLQQRIEDLESRLNSESSES
ncbi:MAG: hypothetical protein LC687_04690 [Actinobacteria bacterium]|nr:hypothetical protein [Actinomycetota bacterium]